MALWTLGVYLGGEPEVDEFEKGGYKPDSSRFCEG